MAIGVDIGSSAVRAVQLAKSRDGLPLLAVDGSPRRRTSPGVPDEGRALAVAIGPAVGSL